MCNLKTRISNFILNFRFSKFVNKKVALPLKSNWMSENHCFAIQYHNVSSSAVSSPTLRERNPATRLLRQTRITHCDILRRLCHRLKINVEIKIVIDPFQSNTEKSLHAETPKAFYFLAIKVYATVLHVTSDKW